MTVFPVIIIFLLDTPSAIKLSFAVLVGAKLISDNDRNDSPVYLFGKRTINIVTS